MMHTGKNILLSLMLLGSWPLMSAQTGSEVDVKALTKNIEERFEACPRREIVAELDRKHHKHVWQKQAWGPPTDVIADVKPNDSILYPYILAIEFSLSWSFGPDRDSKADAEKDTNLSQFATPVMALGRGKNRNVYLVGKDGIRLKAREVRGEKLDGTTGTWGDRPSWPDACWDHIISVKQSGD